jgi:hypothetical protein
MINQVTGITINDECTVQAYKENKCHDSVVHPSMTRFLYEDRCAVVS